MKNRIKAGSLIGLVISMSFACSNPRINSFNITPRAFCSTPQTIRVEWQAVGSEISLTVTPGLARTVVGTSGVRDVPINQTARFLLTASNGRTNVEQDEVASPLSGPQNFALGDGTLYPCSGGGWRMTRSVNAEQFAADVVVRRLNNPNAFPLTVTGPRGGPAVEIPALGFVDYSGSLVGAWDVFMRNTGTPCPPPTAGSADRGIALDIEVGCP